MRRFTQVNVFSSEAYLGNPLAVVHDAEGLERRGDAPVRALDEPVGDDVPAPAHRRRAPTTGLRIFTPSEELPFAGHPTLGSAHAWLEAGGVPRTDGEVVQECPAGLVRVRRGERLAFAAPPVLREGPVTGEERDAAAPGAGARRRRRRGRPLDRQRPGLGRRAAPRRGRGARRTARLGGVRRPRGRRRRPLPGGLGVRGRGACVLPEHRRGRGPGDRQPQREHRPVAGRRPAARRRTSRRRARCSGAAAGCTSSATATPSGSAARRQRRSPGRSTCEHVRAGPRRGWQRVVLA